MGFIAHLCPVIACLMLILLSLLYHPWRRKLEGLKSMRKSPPEPSGASPVIGHGLHLLTRHTSLAQTFGVLANKVGPIFSVKLGSQRLLVISSREAVKECFTSNDKAFATRPASCAGEYLGYNFAAFGLASYDPYWREMRKIVTLQLLSARRVESLKDSRVSEVEQSIKELYSSIVEQRNNNSVVISSWFQQLAVNIVLKSIAGKRYANFVNGVEDDEAKRIRRLIREFAFAAQEVQVSDLFPYALFRWIDFNGSVKNMKRISKEMDAILASWIDEPAKRRLINKENDDDKDQDFIDVMLSLNDNQITNGHTRETIIKATVLNIFLAGVGTSSVLQTWLMSLLLNNRHVMKRAQEEIDTNIGRDRWVEESDIESLSYLQAIVKETLRLHPPGPLLVPHESTQDCYVGGYLVPRGTILLPNVWKLHRDPCIWPEPHEFQPERFLTTHADVDFYGQSFEYLPFGSGRRSCPGITFAMRAAHLTVARLLQGFDFTTPSGLSVNMEEDLDLILSRANPLQVLITPRLPSFLYNN